MPMSIDFSWTGPKKHDSEGKKARGVSNEPIELSDCTVGDVRY